MLNIRRAAPRDAAACGPICYEAFATLSLAHGFLPDFPSPQAATGLLSMLFSHPQYYAVVAEADGQVVGSNVLDERSEVAGLGPVTVDPSAQDHGVGRLLMEAVLDRARERGFAGVRLVQAAFHNRSLALYTRLGFNTVEPLSVMSATRKCAPVGGCTVRKACPSDLDAAAAVCRRVHGISRAGELTDGIAQGAAMVVEREGRITGYSGGFAFFEHLVAESNLDAKALIASAPGMDGPGLLVPTRNSELFRWCLENGLRIMRPMTLMAMGKYHEPAGAYLPSVFY